MKHAVICALILGAVTWTAPAAAQQASITQTIAGTRLDINATGEVTRVPDVAIISAGVITRSTTATGALQDAISQYWNTNMSADEFSAKVAAVLKSAE